MEEQENHHEETLKKVSGLYKDWFLDYASYVILDRAIPVSYTHLDVYKRQDVDYDIQFVGGIKNTIFGGEGLFFAQLRGPGKVWIQTLPISRLASRILQYLSLIHI